jgi:hypothetical protein
MIATSSGPNQHNSTSNAVARISPSSGQSLGEGPGHPRLRQYERLDRTERGGQLRGLAEVGRVELPQREGPVQSDLEKYGEARQEGAGAQLAVRRRMPQHAAHRAPGGGARTAEDVRRPAEGPTGPHELERPLTSASGTVPPP